ncbi:MAG: BamA/TamA family outer membrane protein, partial [Kiritimatiellia bacterium]
NEEYNSDVGIGLRLNIPGFPIRLDYAWPLEVSGDVARTSARFNFWLGYGF